MGIIKLAGNKTLRYTLATLLLLVLFMAVPPSTGAQDTIATPTAGENSPEVPLRVDVQPTARDGEIAQRLQDILEATGWFINPHIRVQNGVVFLSGQVQTAEYKDWAGSLARNTQDVAAVVNQLEVVETALLDFDPLVVGLRTQVRAILRAMPLIGLSLIILILTWLVSGFAIRSSRTYLQRRDMNVLLLNVMARSIGLLVLLGGLYLVFQVAGLTNIALTILGGTGLLGLVLGIAFRDITENFLASIFLSVQNPFSVGDLVEINEVQGFVQRMTTRTTILMTLAGNHVQVPNATVYKSIIHNYTSNPNLRLDFMVGIGYEDSISLTQATIHQVLTDHPAVLEEPEHLVLVDSLGSATVNLQIYCWIDGSQHSYLKVKSSVIRLVKRAIEEAGISMPDEAREMIFPKGVPVRMVPAEPDQQRHSAAPAEQRAQPLESDTVSTSAEGGLRSEAGEIETQARQSRTPESGENLLKTDGTS